MANLVALLEAILSSSSTAVPETDVFNTELVSVLLVNVCVPVSVATVPSIAISSAFAVIPVPPMTFSVTSPVVPPPVRPDPATTEVISPTGIVATCVST